MDAGQVDAVGVEAADGDDFLDLGDADLCRGRHRLVEVARGLAEDEVAALVGLPPLDDGEVGEDAAFADIILSVKILHFLALGNEGADAGLRIEARYARSARTAAFGERALRTELHPSPSHQLFAFDNTGRAPCREKVGQ